MITGSSVHNQRIERFWRDLHRCVTQLYNRLFYYLEFENLLDPLDNVNLYALHFVYLPHINKSLAEFKEGWNNHSIRTAHGRTPNQLYTKGLLQLQRSGLTAVDFFDLVNDYYGVEEGGLSNVGEEVVVPAVQFQLTDELFEELVQLIDPLSASDNFGIELYRQTCEFITRLIRENNVYS